MEVVCCILIAEVEFEVEVVMEEADEGAVEVFSCMDGILRYGMRLGIKGT